MRLEIGQIYGDKYRILCRIGEGAMGAVYEGENVRIHRRVAIKTLHGGVSSNPDTVQRFEREAQAAGRIGSEHIVEVLDMGELDDGTRFMVMEFLEGMTLSKRIRSRGRLTPDETCTFLIELLEGLAGAHQAGIIHRDLKPANVFLLNTKNGQPDFVKILDFGVSKFSLLGGEEMSMTSTGAVLGTPFYMSPEQAKGSAAIDHRSDLYTVGVIAYECVTGQVPYAAETFNELLFKIVLESPPPAESFVPDLDPAFAAILRYAMAREASDRFQTAAEMSAAFQAYLERPKTTGALTAATAPNRVSAQTPPPAPAQPYAVQAAPRPPGFGGAAGGRPVPPRPAAGMPVAPVGMSGTMAMPEGMPGPALPGAPPPPAAPPPPGLAAPPQARAGYGLEAPSGAVPQGGAPMYGGPMFPQQGMPFAMAPQQYPQGIGAPQAGNPDPNAPAPGVDPGGAWGADPNRPGVNLHETAEIPGLRSGNRSIGVAVVLVAAVLLGGGTAIALRWRKGPSSSKTAATTATAPPSASALALVASALPATTSAPPASTAEPLASATAVPTSLAAASGISSARPPTPVAASTPTAAGPKLGGHRPTPASTGTGGQPPPPTKGRTISSEL